MPLQPGSSRSTISTNIGEMINSGYPPKRAAAAAYRSAGKYSGPSRRKRPRIASYVK